jgi:4-amino-4-deoxy-L-arabinose transferase-like glycosyltransferase
MAKRWLLFLCLAAFPLLFLGLCDRSFTDNEGMYAEIGREILLTGDWLTTRLNGVVYLNKPPLFFWLTALVLKVGGLNELPRLLSGLATLGTMLLLCDLGRQIWPGRESAGAWAAAVFLSSALTVAEARVLRPDSLLMFLVCLTLWGVARVSRRPGTPDAWGTAAIWGGIGLAVMVKGLVGALLPALAFVPALLLARRARDVHRYCSGWGLLLAAAIVLPWHVAAGMVNPGFWWDYLVNQHLLYFFDRKFPHDSVSHPLWLAWGVFAGRLAPWLVLLPAAVLSQIRQAKEEKSVNGWLPLTWLGLVWLVFSVSKGRQEHYFLPAVPAAALLVGGLCDRWATEDWISKIERWRVVPFLLVCLTAIAGLAAAPALFRQSDLLATVPGLLPMTQIALTVVAVGSGAAAIMAKFGRFALALGCLVATFLLFGVLSDLGASAAAPLVSARQGFEGIPPALMAQSTVAYEVGEEYQLCGGLDFYLRRRLLLLEPPGFIPPTYMDGHVDELFVKPERFWREWRQGIHPLRGYPAKRRRGRFLLFIDPSQMHNRPLDFYRPYFVVSRGGDRLILTNLPFTK